MKIAVATLGNFHANPFGPELQVKQMLDLQRIIGGNMRYRIVFFLSVFLIFLSACDNKTDHSPIDEQEYVLTDEELLKKTDEIVYRTPQKSELGELKTEFESRISRFLNQEGMTISVVFNENSQQVTQRLQKVDGVYEVREQGVIIYTKRGRQYFINDLTNTPIRYTRYDVKSFHDDPPSVIVVKTGWEWHDYILVNRDSGEEISYPEEEIISIGKGFLVSYHQTSMFDNSYLRFIKIVDNKHIEDFIVYAGFPIEKVSVVGEVMYILPCEDAFFDDKSSM